MSGLLSLASDIEIATRDLRSDVRSRESLLGRLSSTTSVFSDEIEGVGGAVDRVVSTVASLGREVLYRLHDTDLALGDAGLSSGLAASRLEPFRIPIGGRSVEIRQSGETAASLAGYPWRRCLDDCVVVEIPLSVRIDSDVQDTAVVLLLTPHVDVGGTEVAFRLVAGPRFEGPNGSKTSVYRRIPLKHRQAVRAEFGRVLAERVANFRQSLENIASAGLPGGFRAIGVSASHAFFVLSRTSSRGRSRETFNPRGAGWTQAALRIHRDHIVPKIRSHVASAGGTLGAVVFHKLGGFSFDATRREHHEKTILGPWDLDVHVSVFLKYFAHFKRSGRSIAMEANLGPWEIRVSVEDAPTNGAARKAAKIAMETAERKVAEQRRIFRIVARSSPGVRYRSARNNEYGMIVQFDLD